MREEGRKLQGKTRATSNPPPLLACLQIICSAFSPPAGVLAAHVPLLPSRRPKIKIDSLVWMAVGDRVRVLSHLLRRQALFCGNRSGAACQPKKTPCHCFFPRPRCRDPLVDHPHGKRGIRLLPNFDEDFPREDVRLAALLGAIAQNGLKPRPPGGRSEHT